MRFPRAAFLLASFTGFAGAFSSSVDAAENNKKPLWEFGMAIAAVGFADFRGADTSRALPVPLPYFVYRGRFLRADRNGVRGRLFDQEFVELNLSVSATTPVRSRNTSARGGYAGTEILASLSGRYPRYWAAGIGIPSLFGQWTRMGDTGGEEP